MLKNKRLIFSGLAAALLLSGCGKEVVSETLLSEDLIIPSEINYETDTAEYGEYVRTSSDSAGIYYPQEVELYWEKENSYLREMLVEPEMYVKKGDVLAVFDTDVDLVRMEELQLGIEHLLTSAEIEKADRLLAIQEQKEKFAEAKQKRDERREQGYAKENTAELDSYSDAVADLRLQRMQLEYEEFLYQTEWQISRMQKEIAQLQEEMSDNKLIAPFDGVIELTAAIQPGERVLPDKMLISMGATDKLLLAAKDMSDYFQYNMDVIIECGKESDRQTYKGKVVAASNILPAKYGQKLALVKLQEEPDLKELQRKIKYTIKVQDMDNILLVDRTAVQKENDETFVYVLNGDMVQKRYVVVGSSNNEKTWILDGLSEGQTVITD